MKRALTVFEALLLADGVAMALSRLVGVDPRLALRLAYNARALQTIVAPYRDAERALAENYAARDGTGKMIETPKHGVEFFDREAFDTERRALLAESFDVELKEIPLALLPAAIDAELVDRLYTLIVEPSEGEDDLAGRNVSEA